MSTDNPQENKIIAEYKSQPVDEKSTVKPLSIRECYVLLRQVDHLTEQVKQLPHPDFALINTLLPFKENKRSAESRQVNPRVNEILAQLEALKLYHEQLTTYGNYFETLWADICARRSKANVRTFEQHAAESVLLSALADKLYQVTQKNVAAQSSIRALEKHVPKSNKLLSVPDNKNPARDKTMEIKDVVGNIHHLAGAPSFLDMRLVQQRWKTSLYAYKYSNSKYPFTGELRTIHQNLEALSKIQLKDVEQNVNAVTRSYAPLVFYYCLLNPLYANFVLQHPARYGVTSPQAYLIELCHDWLTENSIQELIRLQLKYQEEFTSCYFIQALEFIYRNPNYLMRNFIKPAIQENVRRTQVRQREADMIRNGTPMPANWPDSYINEVMQAQWGWLNAGIRTEDVMGASLDSLLTSLIYFMLQRSDFGLHDANSLSKKVDRGNPLWNKFYMEIFFITERVKKPVSIFYTDFAASSAAEYYPLFATGIIAACSAKKKLDTVILLDVFRGVYKFNPQIAEYILDRYVMDMGAWEISDILLSVGTNARYHQRLFDKYTNVKDWLGSPYISLISTFGKANAVNAAIIEKISKHPFAAAPILFHKIAKKLTPQQLERIAMICVKDYPHIVSCIIEAHGERLDAATQVKLLELLPKAGREVTVAYLQGINRLKLENKQVFQLLSIIADEKTMLKDNKREIKTSDGMMETYCDDSTDKPASNSSPPSVFGSSSSFYGSSASSSNSSLSSGSITLDEKRSQTTSSPVSTLTPEKQEEDVIYINKNPVSVKQIEQIKEAGSVMPLSRRARIFTGDWYNNQLTKN